MDEALEWARRAPMQDGDVLEIRPVFEAEDFGAELTPELREQEERLRAEIDALTREPALRDYHLLPSVRGDLLFKLGRLDEARREFERAASLTRNQRERRLLLDRAAACAPASA